MTTKLGIAPLLGALTWLFTWLVVRSATPGRFSAVFFGTWGAIVVAALVFRSTTRPTRTQPSNPSGDGSHHNPATRDDTAY
ncbi:hypothetical protein [Brevibacterium litoralis]|uniref:hypothetical protein n=1 Tax=Brevibacterium litoralis TaxID=3138935 RepID=UPI0032F075EA